MDTNTGIHRGTSPRRGRARRGVVSPPASRLVQGTFKSNAPQNKESNAPRSSTKNPTPNSGKMNLMASVSRSSGLGKDGDEQASVFSAKNSVVIEP